MDASSHLYLGRGVEGVGVFFPGEALEPADALGVGVVDDPGLACLPFAVVQWRRRTLMLRFLSRHSARMAATRHDLSST